MNQTDLTLPEAPYTITRHGDSTWNVTVVGFLSSSVINIYAQYNRYHNTVALNLNVSTGGRDQKAVKSDIEAYRNYGLAILAATDFMRDMDLVSLAAEFKAAEDAGIEQYEAERAAEKAKQEADPVDSYEKMSAAVHSMRGQVGQSVTFQNVSWANQKLTVIVSRSEHGWSLCIKPIFRGVEHAQIEHCANLSKINAYLKAATAPKLV